MSTDLHTLAGAYALDALSPEEAENFGHHLEECTACREEVGEFRDVAAQMGESESIAPPPYLKARVLSAADEVAQLPPRVVPITAAPSRRWRPRILAAAAAVVLMLGVGVGIRISQNNDNGSVMASSVARVFHAPDARQATVDTANGGKLTVAASPALHRMAVDTSKLKPLSGRQVYQIWAVAGGKATSVGVLTDLGGGAAMPMPAPHTDVAITIEPAGGSKQPTTRPIVTVDPSQV
jgi:anti-sigma-K factor RskA